MKPAKKSLKSSAKPETTAAAKTATESAPAKPKTARVSKATSTTVVQAEPEKKPAKRSLLEAAVEGVKAVVRRSPKKSSPTPAASTSGTVSEEKIAAASKPAEPPASRKAKVELPAMLFEGDESPAPKVSGPGERYVLGPTPPVEKLTEGEELGELPTAYGTQRLTLTARDPHWLYAHWDLTDDQLRDYNRASKDGHLIVRVFLDAVGGKPFTEMHVHPESRNWFVHVGKGGAKFVAELGYYAKKAGKWTTVSTSKATLTPPDSLSDDTSVRFATIPVELSFQQLLALIKQALKDNVPLVEAIQQLRASGQRQLPDRGAIASAKWTAAQEQAMSEVITMDSVRRVWMGSLEITELLRRQLVKDISSISAAQLSLPSSISVSSLSSPFGGVPGRKGFWFNVNAELIIYGATEPDATVSIGGRKIKLRPDGTFSYRFILPDGQYNLPAIATSAAGDDTRIADLAFSRSTEYSGEVGAHPQDPSMKPPKSEHVS